MPRAITASKALTPGRIGDLELRNRFIRAGCFEGMSQGGWVTPALVEHHRRVAAGGAAMTTVAYCSVSPEGRAFDHELWMCKEIMPGLRKLIEAVHGEGAAASVQLGHCGFFASPKVIGRRPLGASRKLCLYHLSRCEEMSEAEIKTTTEDFVRAAQLARQAGFDAIEIHAGHGYLFSQFLSPWTNHRRDRYGGALENRLRFPAQVIRGVRQALGPGFPILIKMNQRDGMRGGLEIDEAIQIARRFELEGASMLIPSCGFTAKTPLYMMRGHVPMREMARNQRNPLARLSTLLFGRFLVQAYPFRSLFLLDGALQILQSVTIPVAYVGGVLSLADMEQVMQAGFEFAQVGRAIVCDPDFVNKLHTGTIEASDCDHCNRCIAAMESGGVYCVTYSQGQTEVKHTG
ncbi:MAG: NADH:flavin oxidoreductase [Anaerolineae bacterium]|jgi:2,4-dienoyl-CoA reductase-like NADH-dependent reductase (Old Yellow Enzyme family)